LSSVFTIEDISLEIASGIACALSQVVSDGVLHLRPFSVTDDGRLSISDAPRIPQSAVPENKMRFEIGDILFNNTNSVELVGKSAVFSNVLEASFSNHMTRIRINQRHAEPGYVHAFLRHLHGRRFFQDRATRWVSQAAFGTAQLKALEIPLPPLEEQRRIVGLLDRAAEIRRRVDAAHAKARATIHALFADIFGPPATLLERYPVAEMEQIISDKQLGLVRSTREQPEDGAYGYVRMNSITTDGRVVLDDLRRTDASDREAKINELRDGDLLFNTRNSLELVGKMGIYRGPSGNLFNNNIMRIRLSGVVCAEYLNAYFQCTEGRAAIDAIKKGTTSVCAVYYKDLARVRLPVPPIVLQSVFAEQTQRLETIARHLDAAAAKAEAMAAGLSAEVFG
jgi:type I restriction enzyme S subunit